MFLESQQAYKSVGPIHRISLPDFVILTGLNGSGKSHLLAAIDSYIVRLLDDDGRAYGPGADFPHPHGPIKLVLHSTLAPQDGIIASEINVRKRAEELANKIEAHKKAKIEAHKNAPVPSVILTAKDQSLLRRIASLAHKDVDSLTPDDIVRNYPPDDDFEVRDMFSQAFSTIFKSYALKYSDNEFRRFRSQTKPEIKYLSEEEFFEQYKEPPWRLVNSILTEAGLDYEVNNPENDEPSTPFHLKLRNTITGVEINFADLSGGEKAIMSLALALYNAKFEVNFPNVLLMDEPDAHLHPSMTRKFLDVIQKVFVRDKNLKVIITTHSPSTVALAPEESIFVMNKTEPRIVKATKDEALSILTSGVPTLSIDYENRRQVFVESKHDVGIYEIAYNKVKDKLVSDISINFISSGTSGSGNSDQVRTVVNKLAMDFGNRSIYGIIDWDLKNNGNEHVKVLGRDQRYSIENYVLDPLLLSAFLLREKFVDRATFGLSESETYTDLPRFDDERLQVIADRTLALIKPHVADSQDESTVGADYIGGRHIDLPMWFCKAQGHELEESVRETFQPLKRYGDALKLEIMKKVVDDLPDLLPADFLHIFQEIQNYQSSRARKK